MERVSIIEGSERVLLLCPHGSDDTLTTVITEKMANKLDAFAIINRGWQRATDVDFWNDKANCNSIEQLHKPVVKEEFLDPILEYIYKIRRIPELQCSPTVYVFLIHGFSSQRNVDIVVGYGKGTPQRHSCDIWRKDALVYFLNKAGFETYEGAANSNYAGWGRDNLNQLFSNIWYPDHAVQSMQLEISKNWRMNPTDAEDAASEIAEAIDNLLCCQDSSPFWPVGTPLHGVTFPIREFP